MMEEKTVNPIRDTLIANAEAYYKREAPLTVNDKAVLGGLEYRIAETFSADEKEQNCWFDKAYKHCQEASEALTQQSNPLHRKIVYRTLGFIYEKRHAAEQARFYLRKALSLYDPEASDETKNRIDEALQRIGAENLSLRSGSNLLEHSPFEILMENYGVRTGWKEKASEELKNLKRDNPNFENVSIENIESSMSKEFEEKLGNNKHLVDYYKALIYMCQATEKFQAGNEKEEAKAFIEKAYSAFNCVFEREPNPLSHLFYYRALSAYFFVHGTFDQQVLDQAIADINVAISKNPDNDDYRTLAESIVNGFAQNYEPPLVLINSGDKGCFIAQKGNLEALGKREKEES